MVKGTVKPGSWVEGGCMALASKLQDTWQVIVRGR